MDHDPSALADTVKIWKKLESSVITESGAGINDIMFNLKELENVLKKLRADCTKLVKERGIQLADFTTVTRETRCISDHAGLFKWMQNRFGCSVEDIFEAEAVKMQVENSSKFLAKLMEESCPDYVDLNKYVADHLRVFLGPPTVSTSLTVKKDK